MRTQNNAFLTVARPAGALTAIEVEFKIDARFTRGTYMRDRWVSRFGPLALDGTSLSVDVRARGVTANGQSTNISPQWVPADPQMVTVTPIEGTNEFRLTVQRAGESTVAVSAQRMSKQLTVKAAHQGGAIVVEIAQ
jgi:hypothetical protein